MKKSKIILASAAAIVALAGAFAFTSHNNKKFGSGTLYTRSGSPLTYHSIGCIRNGGATLCATATYYTFTSPNYNSKGRITPSLANQ